MSNERLSNNDDQPDTGTAARGGKARSTLGGVQSVDRAIRAMKILAATGGAGVSEVAEQIGVHKSTAFRLLAALEEHDLVRQAESRGHYELGFGIQRLASAVTGQMDLVRQARPVMDVLAERLGETVNIAVLRDHVIVNVGQSIGGSAVAAHNWIGELTPAHATSSGKVLLAALPPDERAPLLRDLKAYTDHTITDGAVLEAQLKEAAERGWAQTENEYELGLRAVAVPVRDHAGDVVAALSVSGPSYRFEEDRLPEIIELIQESGRAASARLGYLRP